MKSGENSRGKSLVIEVIELDVYSRVKKGREKGIYNNEIRKEQQRKRLVIEVIELNNDSRASQDDDVSPLTATTIDSFVDEDMTGVPSLPSNVKKTR